MTMSCRDAFDEGYQYGFSAAKYTDFDDDKYVGDKGKVGPETVGEFWEEFSGYAAESETNARDYSPWEFTAEAINEASEESEYDLWQCYEDGAYAGIKAGFVKRYKLTDAKQDKSVQQFGKELEIEAKASRAEQPDDGGAEGNPYLGDAVKLAKQRKYGYPTPPTSRGATIPAKASSNPAKRRLMR